MIKLFIISFFLILNINANEEGFVKIFNGKDLSGWIGAKDGYKVTEDGTIAALNRKKNIYTEKQYSDFVLRFEVKMASGANNGIGIRTPAEGKATLECQILDNSSPRYANKKDYQYHGSLYSLIGAKKGFLKPVGEWNVQEISVIGSKVKVTLNGTVILDVDMSQLKKQNKGTKRTIGHIALLGHGAGVFFRNMRVKEIKK